MATTDYFMDIVGYRQFASRFPNSRSAHYFCSVRFPVSGKQYMTRVVTTDTDESNWLKTREHLDYTLELEQIVSNLTKRTLGDTVRYYN